MTLEQALRTTNRGMIGFDLLLGGGSVIAPRQMLTGFFGHDEPSPEAVELLRRCGPIWLTFAAAHAVAEVRGEPRDWWALAWLRATEIATDAVWAQRSPALNRPGTRAALRLAGVANLAMAVGFGRLASKRDASR